MTGQALLAVNGAAFPLAPVPRAVVERRRRHGVEHRQAWLGQERRPARRAPRPEGGGRRRPRRTPAAPLGPSRPHPARAGLLEHAATDGGGGLPGWLIGVAVVALVAAAIWGGWVLYRRRLP